MANASPLMICHSCKKELPHPIPDKCPHCDRKLAKNTNPYFADLDYLVYQFEDHKDALDINKVDKPATAEAVEEWKEIKKSLSQYLIKDWSIHDKVACLKDANLMMKHVLLSNHTGIELEALVTLAKNIGELGLAIETYIRTGGAANDTGQIPT